MRPANKSSKNYDNSWSTRFAVRYANIVIAFASFFAHPFLQAVPPSVFCEIP